MNDEPVELLQKKIDLINNNKEEIAKTSSVSELYLLMDKINDAVSSIYSNISCKDRCFLCCQHTNIPTATSPEWKIIYEFILSSSDQFKNALIKSVTNLFSVYGKELRRIHFAIESNDDEYKLKELYSLLPKFKGNSCLFLKKGSCSIYEVRPAKCRSQGYSLIQFIDNIQFQTCSPEAVRMEALLQKQGNRKVLMPFWNDYEKQIQSFQDDFAYTIIPVWLFSHISGNVFVTQVCTNPDFSEIMKEFV